jgi:putative spermidine/putrescine transport system ATP-binding protein
LSDAGAGIRINSASLDLHQLSKHYGSLHAVDGVTLHVQQGEFLTLLGPSGSGKTTTLRLVAGFMQPSAGSIKIADRDVTTIPPHKRDIGMVFQSYALFPHMTAAANIMFPLQMRGIPKAKGRQLVAEALSLVRLEGLGDRYPRQLSGGQQQRVAFARAVVFKPRLLLMDEPLGALDKQLREALQLEIKALHRDLGITIVHVTHDQEEALVLSDRIALFRQGKIEQVGGATELYERPASVFVADFIGESNIFRGRLERKNGECQIVGEGRTMRCGPGVDSDWRSGESVAIVVRPERITLRNASDQPDPAMQRELGRIRQVMYLGSTVKYQLESSGKTIFARHDISSGGALREPGDEVAIEWRPDQCAVVHDSADAPLQAPATADGSTA